MDTRGLQKCLCQWLVSEKDRKHSCFLALTRITDTDIDLVKNMLLIIDGYNLLHVGRSLGALRPDDLQRERDRLIDQVSSYRHSRPCEITVIFDGWKEGEVTERKERRKGIDLVFSKVGEKADEVIKRLVREKGAGVVVVTSDREVAGFVEKRGATAVSSEQFRERMRMAATRPPYPEEKGIEPGGEEGGPLKKGSSRRLSKKEKKLRAALRKL